MSKILGHTLNFRRHLFSIVGFCLAAYFAYHVVLGERSYIRLHGLHTQIEQQSSAYHELHTAKLTLENKVKGLRPSSLDKDLLEERVQYVLGYYPDGTNIILK